jgi:membrane protein required for colicin V production
VAPSRDEVLSQMPSYLDLAVLGIVLVSALLSMMRGFTREVLAIASWAAAAAAAYYFYPILMPYLTPYIHKEIIAQAAAAALVFFVTLIVVSLFTVRLSDAILDSRVGALDRSLGFVFGVARGFLLAVVAFAIFNWLVSEKQQPEWVKNARTRPVLTETATRIVTLLPSDAAQTINGWIESHANAATNDLNNSAASRPKTEDDQSIAVPSTPAPAPKKSDSGSGANGGSPMDKQKLDALINKNAPFAPAPKQ